MHVQGLPKDGGALCYAGLLTPGYGPSRKREPVMHMILQSLVCALALTTAASAAPSRPQALTAAFEQMGGEALPSPTEAKNVSGLPPLLWPMRDVPRQVMASAYFSERRLSDGTATAERTRDLFARQCVVEGGRIEPADSNAAKAFEKWATVDRLPTTQQYKHRWRAISSLCAHGAERFLGGFYAAVFDATGTATEGDIGSRAMMWMFPVKTLTAVYLFNGDGIGPRSIYAKSSDQYLLERMQASHAEEEKQTAQLRAGVKVGSETNCGTVIEVRPPLVQIAVPATRQTPNGQPTFWSRIDRLVPAGFGAICMFGL